MSVLVVDMENLRSTDVSLYELEQSEPLNLSRNNINLDNYIDCSDLVVIKKDQPLAEEDVIIISDSDTDDKVVISGNRMGKKRGKDASAADVTPRRNPTRQARNCGGYKMFGVSDDEFENFLAMPCIQNWTSNSTKSENNGDGGPKKPKLKRKSKMSHTFLDEKTEEKVPLKSLEPLLVSNFNSLKSHLNCMREYNQTGKIEDEAPEKFYEKNSKQGVLKETTNYNNNEVNKFISRRENNNIESTFSDLLKTQTILLKLVRNVDDSEIFNFL